MTYNIRHTRLVFSRKLPDRYLSCQVATGSELDKVGKRGMIVTIIEILTPWAQATTIGQLISNKLAREFFRGESENDVTNFENAVRTVNEEIAINEMEKDPAWRSKINAFLALVIENEVHFTQTGNIWADIYRKRKLLKVSDPDLNLPIKTNFIFSSLTSGNMEDDDVLLVGTKKMLENASEVDGTIHHPSQLAPYILGQEKNKQIFSGIALQINTKESLSEKETSNYPDTIFLDQPLELVGKKIQYTIKNSLIPSSKAAYDASKKFANKSNNFLHEKVWPHISHTLLKASKATKKGVSTIHNKIITKKNNEDNEAYKTDYKVNYYSKSAKKLTKKASIKSFFILRKIKKINISRIPFLSGKKSYISIAVILLLILTVVSYNRYNSTSRPVSKESINIQITELSKNLDDARNAILYGENDKAIAILSESISKAEELIKNGGDTIELENILAQLNTQLDQINKVTRISSEIELTAPENTKKIYLLNGKLWALKDDGTILHAPAAGGSFNNDEDFKVEKLSSSTSSEKNNNIYILDQSKKMSILSTTNNTLTQVVSENSEWEKSIDFAFYVNNLYLLNEQTDNIMKYSAKDDKFASPIEYLANPINGMIRSITVDGSIYLLLNDGSIKKVEKNKITDFELKNLPASLSKEKFTRIYTSVNREYLYISTDRILVVTDKDGNFINQYVFNNAQTIKDFYLSDKGTSIWILSDRKIFSYNLR